MTVFGSKPELFVTGVRSIPHWSPGCMDSKAFDQGDELEQSPPESAGAWGSKRQSRRFQVPGPHSAAGGHAGHVGMVWGVQVRLT